MNIGIIGLGNLGLNLLNFLSEQQHEIYVSDVDGDNVEVIRNSDIIFCCVDTNILPSNFLDITNVMAVVEDFGVSFEDEIPLYNKTFVWYNSARPATENYCVFFSNMDTRPTHLNRLRPRKPLDFAFACSRQL